MPLWRKRRVEAFNVFFYGNSKTSLSDQCDISQGIPRRSPPPTRQTIEQVGGIILHRGFYTHDKIPANRRWALWNRTRPSTSESEHVPSPKKTYPWPRKTPRFLKKEPFPHANKKNSYPATLFFPFVRPPFSTGKKKKLRSSYCWFMERSLAPIATKLALKPRQNSGVLAGKSRKLWWLVFAMPWRATSSNFWTVAKKPAHVSSRLPFSQVVEIVSCVTAVGQPTCALISVHANRNLGNYVSYRSLPKMGYVVSC